MSAPGHLTLEDLERLGADVQRCCVDTGCTCPAARLLVALRSVMAEREALRADAKLGRLAREWAKASRVLATVHADFGWGRKRSAAYADFSDAEARLDQALAADLEAPCSPTT